MADELAETNEAARLSRRAALKAGVAAGVGAAALAGPQIGMLGSTPAYAAACSQPWDEISYDCSATSCDCVDAGGTKYINYKPVAVTGLSTSGGCSHEGASATVTVPAGYAQCRVDIEVWTNGNSACENQNGTFLGGGKTTATAGGAVALPTINCASFADNSGIFLRLTLECNKDTDIPCT